MEDWEFSSFRDYIGLRDKTTFVNKTLAFELIDIPQKPELLLQQSNEVIVEKTVTGQVMT